MLKSRRLAGRPLFPAALTQHHGGAAAEIARSREVRAIIAGKQYPEFPDDSVSSGCGPFPISESLATVLQQGRRFHIK
jgi:hypothetical protein